eukprot:scaffold158930_cov43-Prasinocladus_malaysianus.AAC.1
MSRLELTDPVSGASVFGWLMQFNGAPWCNSTEASSTDALDEKCMRSPSMWCQVGYGWQSGDKKLGPNICFAMCDKEIKPLDTNA